MAKRTLAELRAAHPRFIFQHLQTQLDGNTLSVEFEFILEPGIVFKPQLSFPNLDLNRYQQLDPQLIQAWLLRIGMVELLSYWKAAAPAEIVIRAGYLTDEEIAFWSKLLQYGMSEFFFVNQIDGWATDFVHFVIEAAPQKYVIDQSAKQPKILVPVGGGKDSVVTIETLKKTAIPLTIFNLNSTPAGERIKKISEVTSQIQVTRRLDPRLLELNQADYLNGHTPFSALLAFISTFVAYLGDFQDVALSNEWSANEGNLLFLGQMINHQYSKTLAFETDFRTYMQRYLSTAIHYFSFLRPLHEVQIAGLFSRYPQYFAGFLSCNRGSKDGIWCGVCPKCLFVAVALAPFLSIAQITQIFGRNILDDQSLQPILDELSGVVEYKSLECVGTREETLVALDLAVQKNLPQPLPALLAYAQAQILPQHPELAASAPQMLGSYQENNFLPPALDHLLRQQIQS